MNKKTIGYILIGLGVVGVVVSLAADYIGIGSYPGINGTQFLAAGLSLVVALVGVWFARSKEEQPKQ